MKSCKRLDDVIKLWIKGKKAKCRSLVSDGVNLTSGKRLIAQRMGEGTFAIDYYRTSHSPKIHRELVIEHIDSEFDDRWENQAKTFIKLDQSPTQTLLDMMDVKLEHFLSRYNTFRRSRKDLIVAFRDISKRLSNLSSNDRATKKKYKEILTTMQNIMKDEDLHLLAIVGE